MQVKGDLYFFTYKLEDKYLLNGQMNPKITTEAKKKNKVFFFKDILLIFREKGRKKERNMDVRRKHQLAAACTHSARDQARSLGIEPATFWCTE